MQTVFWFSVYLLGAVLCLVLTFALLLGAWRAWRQHRTWKTSAAQIEQKQHDIDRRINEIRARLGLTTIQGTALPITKDREWKRN